MTQVARGVGPGGGNRPGVALPIRIHDLLLTLAGRLDDDALADVRLMLAAAELDRSLEFLAGCLAAGRVVLTREQHAELEALFAETYLDSSVIDRVMVTDRIAAGRHRFAVGSVDGREPDRGVADAVRPVLDVLPDVRSVWCVWRLTPAGPASGPVPHLVVLVGIGPGGFAPATAYRVEEALRRAGIRASVEVLVDGVEPDEYHREAMRNARQVPFDGPGSTLPRVEPARNRVELPRIEPARASAVPAEPPRVEPSRVEPLHAEPPRADPAGAESPRSEPSRPESHMVEPFHAESPRVEPPRAEPSRVEPPRAESSRVEPPRAESSRVEPPRAESSRVDLPRAESRVEPPRGESSRVDLPRAESRVEPPRAESSRVDLPRAESRVEPPRAELSRVDPPRAERSRMASPRPEPSHAEPSAMELSEPPEPPRMSAVPDLPREVPPPVDAPRIDAPNVEVPVRKDPPFAVEPPVQSFSEPPPVDPPTKMTPATGGLVDGESPKVEAVRKDPFTPPQPEPAPQFEQERLPDESSEELPPSALREENRTGSAPSPRPRPRVVKDEPPAKEPPAKPNLAPTAGVDKHSQAFVDDILNTQERNLLRELQDELARREQQEAQPSGSWQVDRSGRHGKPGQFDHPNQTTGPMIINGVPPHPEKRGYPPAN